MVNPWTDEIVEQFRALVAEGLSASEIAKRLGEPFTRNSVIGKSHRLKIQIGAARIVRLEPSRAQKRAHRAKNDASLKVVTLADFRRPKPAPKPVFAFVPPPPDLDCFDEVQEEPTTPVAAAHPFGVALMDLEWKHCRWPLGKGKEVSTHFCGENKARGSYCETHARLAYVGTEAERRAEYKRQQRALLRAAE